MIGFIIGIDPGKDGGIAVIDREGKLVALSRMPLDTEKEIDVCALKLFEDTHQAFCFIERAFCMPMQSTISTFTCGIGYGKLISALELKAIPYSEIRAQVWKKHFGLLKQDKIKSVELASNLFPSAKDLFYTPRGRMLDGLAEALLIAEYGRRKLVGEIK
jgi:crossover junction endodeoxyribonuclease RuvC